MWPLELKFLAKTDIAKGSISPAYCTKLWLFFTVILWLSLFLINLQGGVFVLSVCLAPILARLIALDLCYLVLPDIYTLPLLFLGLFLSVFSNFTSITFLESLLGIFVGGGGLLLLAILLERVEREAGIGGGDIKMVAAAGSFLGISSIATFLWVSCMLAFVLYPFLKRKKQPISFGPALIVSLWVFIIYPHPIEKLIDMWL